MMSIGNPWLDKLLSLGPSIPINEAPNSHIKIEKPPVIKMERKSTFKAFSLDSFNKRSSPLNPIKGIITKAMTRAILGTLNLL